MGVQEQYLDFFEGPTLDIRDYRVKVWRNLPPDEQDRWVEEVFDYYRNTHGFPYFEMSDREIHRTLWKLRNKTPKVNGNVIMWNFLGSTLSAIYFPHIWEVSFRDKRTAMEAYLNDDILRQAIRLCFRIKPSVGPSDLVGAFTLGTNASVGLVSRFKPIAAKVVWDRYAPEGGLCYDYACGWGGRLMGCMASHKGLRYVGVDPEPRTHRGLLALSDKLLEVYGSCPADIYMEGSEDFCPEELHGQVDVAFSSPPYFDLEKYSDDPTQSHIKYPEVDLWLDGYIVDTFKNVRTLLKPGGYLGLNLIDYDEKGIVGGALERIRNLGFVEHETLQIQMAQRRGKGQNTNRAFKHEPVFVFRKK